MTVTIILRMTVIIDSVVLKNLPSPPPTEIEVVVGSQKSSSKAFHSGMYPYPVSHFTRYLSLILPPPYLTK